MKRKGGIAPFIIVIMVSGLIALFFIILFPQQGLGKVRDAAFFFGVGSLPEERAPEFLGTKEIPLELERYFNILVANINNAAGKDNCLVSTSELRIDDKWLIELTEDKAQIWSKSKYSSRGATATGKKPVTLKNFKPCSLKGPSATTFYNRFLKEGPKIISAVIPQHEDNIILDKDNNKIKFLFKSTGERVCFIPSYDDGGTSCDNPRDNGQDVIDDDCRSKIPSFENNLLRCDDQALTNTLNDKACRTALKKSSEFTNTFCH